MEEQDFSWMTYANLAKLSITDRNKALRTYNHAKHLERMAKKKRDEDDYTPSEEFANNWAKKPVHEDLPIDEFRSRLNEGVRRSTCRLN